ncbi:hypothetical protein EV356DRAFT_512152 [Viridothelium virens]|uniref:Heterokaryon incompatibility domain-containing protein n=1 Tax=Viridothelium virens TaxID=1048519 RepID=A0A6A6GSU7_VIRVR|nr:hypothetical protein EV356DRAFT_512152 [Viridothelium virens]
MAYPCQLLPSRTSIRVLKLSQEESKCITVRSSAVELDDMPRYSCLSYTWDGPRYCDTDDSWTKSDQAIVLDDTNFCVRRNLHLAMLHLLAINETGPIWIDAISINQTDIAERTSQVSQMARIYSQAEAVTVWLGKEEADTALAIQSMSKLALDIGELIDHNSDFYELFKKSYSNTHYTDAELVVSIDFMTTYQWFSRVWTVQEMCLAGRIEFLCGKRKIDIETILKGSLVTFMYSLSSARARLHDTQELEWARSFAANLLGELAGRKFDSSRPSIGVTAQMYRSRKATDPRDKVFGVAGISVLKNKFLSKPFEIDYAKSVQRVFSDAAVHALGEARGLESLSDVGDRTTNATPDLPSWVPDYTRELSPRRRIRSANEFCAVSKYQTIVYTTPEPSIVVLLGCHFDTITRVCDAFWGPEDPNKVLNLLRLVSDVQTRILSPDETLSMLLERTLVADTGENPERNPANDRSSGFQRWLFSQVCSAVLGQDHGAGTAFIRDPESNLESALRSIGFTGYLEDTLRESLLKGARLCESEEAVKLAARGRQPMVEQVYASFMDTQTYEYYNDWQALCQHRKLFLTQRGYVGLGLSRVQVEDRIYLLQGGIVPHVFRHQPKDGEDVLDFEGEAYVHGIMYGEATKSDDLQFRKITVY